jgi:hypothetical protein
MKLKFSTVFVDFSDFFSCVCVRNLFSVMVLLGVGCQEDWDLISHRYRIFSSPQHPIWCWAHTPSYSMGTIRCLGGKEVSTECLARLKLTFAWRPMLIVWAVVAVFYPFCRNRLSGVFWCITALPEDCHISMNWWLIGLYSVSLYAVVIHVSDTSEKGKNN